LRGPFGLLDASTGKRILKDMGLIERAHGIEFADELLRNDPTTVMNRFRESWNNLLAAFTEPLVGPKLELMNMLSDAVLKLSSACTHT
jgi:hypothetical protein